MAFLNRPTPEDAELAEFARSLRATFVTPTPESQVTAIAPRLAEEARIAYAQGRSEDPRAERRGESRLKQVGQLAIGFCLVPLVAAGLATAGVKLPEPAQSAFESVGIDLPNQKEPQPEAPAPQAPATPSGEAPAAAPESGSNAAKENPKPEKGPGKAKGKAKGQQGEAPGKSGTAGSNGNGNGSSGSPGKSGSAPGRNKPSGSAGSGGSAGGNGKAVGRTGATPPGQAGKPASPGNSASGKKK